MEQIDIACELSGNWIGDWGIKENVLVHIDVNGEIFTGHYVLSGKKTEFSGSIRKEFFQILLTFSPPMSNNSGGYFDCENKRLVLFCEDIKGNFVKQEN